MTPERKRVRARLILMGDMFKPIVEALDSGASPEAIASGTTLPLCQISEKFCMVREGR